MGIQAGLAGTVLAALVMLVLLGYAMGSAVTTRDGYAAMALRREIEDLRAQNALLRYRINLAESSQRIQETAARMDLRLADPVEEVDYVVLPYPEAETTQQLVKADPSLESGGLTAVLRELAAEVAISARGRAEASPNGGHRP